MTFSINAAIARTTLEAGQPANFASAQRSANERGVPKFGRASVGYRKTDG